MPVVALLTASTSPAAGLASVAVMLVIVVLRRAVTRATTGSAY
jgi:hypothetical protein